jgi:hypothetical protein
VGEGVVTVRGLSQADVTALGARVVKVTQEANKTYDVTLQGSLSEDGARLAQQLLTTLATLVVAVAGFYFGTSAVAAAASAVGGPRPLAIVTSTLPPYPAGQAYSGQRLQATGGTPPYTWTLFDKGDLNPAPRINPDDGEVTGSFTGPGGWFSVQVEDKLQVTVVKKVRLTVKP